MAVSRQLVTSTLAGSVWYAASVSTPHADP